MPNARAFFAALLAVAALSAGAGAEDARRVDVSSDEVEYSADGKSAVFRGNVRIAAGGLQLHAATLRVQSGDSGNTYFAEAGAAPLSLFCDDCAIYPIRGQIGTMVQFDDTPQRLQLSGGVTLCADDDCARGKVEAQRADWQQAQQMLRLFGAPLVHTTWQLEDSPEPLVTRAQQVEVQMESGEAALRGEAHITHGESAISGDVIHINLKTGALRAEAQANKRVQATFGGEDG